MTIATVCTKTHFPSAPSLGCCSALSRLFKIWSSRFVFKWDNGLYFGSCPLEREQKEESLPSDSGLCPSSPLSAFYCCLRPSVAGTHSTAVHQTNPLCDNGCCEKFLSALCWNSTATKNTGTRWRDTLQADVLAAALESNTHQLAICRKILAPLAVSFSRRFGSPTFLLSSLILVWKKAFCPTLQLQGEYDLKHQWSMQS